MPNVIYLLSWIIGLCVLWLIWSLGFKSLSLDYFRERLFELRFKLFRLGMSGDLPFDSDAYRSLETLMCGLLRYAHRVTLLTYIFSLVEQERAKQEKDYVDFGRQIALRISRLDTGTQKKLAEIVSGVRTSIILYMAFSSLLMMAIIVGVKVAKLLGLWKPSKATLTAVIEQEAYKVESRRSVSMAAA
jgi:hypothetical protein